MSLNKRLRTEIYYLYKISAKITVCLCSLANQTTQLKSDIKVLIVTKSNCKRVVKSKLYKEVTCELVQEIVTRSNKKIVKSETHKEVIQNLVHER